MVRNYSILGRTGVDQGHDSTSALPWTKCGLGAARINKAAVRFMPLHLTVVVAQVDAERRSRH